MLGRSQTIAIIGAGLSGTLAAIQLLRQADSPFRLLLIERNPRPARGVAYSTTESCHVLNVPASNMSVFPEVPSHFYDWLKVKNPSVLPTDFVPRRLYGDYLNDCLQQARIQAESGTKVTLELLQQDVIQMTPQGEQYSLHLKDGQTLLADRVVLALGNAPSVPPAQPQSNFYQHSRFHSDPWDSQSWASTGSQENILIIGTGLSMVDKVVEATEKGFQGKIYALSRSGLLPGIHDLSKPPYAGAFEPAACQSVRRLVAHVRALIAQGHDWRSVMDGLRPYRQMIWQGFSTSEKRRFLRHVRPYGESHRHRMAPVIGKQVHQLIQEGRLIILAGRLQDYIVQEDRVEVRYRPRGLSELHTLWVHRVLNCSGSGSDFRRRYDPLVSGLIQQGLLVPDAFGLGIEAQLDGCLLNRQGHPVRGLYTLGPPLRGLLWEITSVPEIRIQAQALATTLLATLCTEAVPA